ncbi:RNA 3'-terminal phosphate cyclase [Candidatus Woesearchaeota archaeon]|nr:RNA 3'-terminal phosphate cyclase [Candidatus Woesearchaeota archaeon]
MITLDGSHAEGGGSIVRVALALSTLTQKAFTINNIRANRPNPGLKNQHLFCIKALEKLCNADTSNAELGSTSLKFVPGKFQGKNIEIDIGTAGSIPLFLQSVLLPSIFSNKSFSMSITGGTDVKWAPQIDYFMEVFLPQIKRFADVECKLVKRGYYPKGEGKVEIKVKPKFKISSSSNFNELSQEINKNLQKIDLVEQETLIQIKGVSHASSELQGSGVAERQAKAAEISLKNYEVPINIRSEYWKTDSIGSGITLWAIFSKDSGEIDVFNPIRIGASSLGNKGKVSESVGEEAAKNLMKEISSEAPLDNYLADQLLKYLTVLPGSKIRTSSITGHTKSNLYVIEKFLGNCVIVDEKENIISSFKQ